MGRRYYAGRRLQLDDRVAKRGDEVPEAAGWRHLQSYLDSGRITVVAAEEPVTATPTPAPVVPEPVVEPKVELAPEPAPPKAKRSLKKKAR